MFRKGIVARNKVYSDEGFVVQVYLGAGDVHYWEGARYVKLAIGELMNGYVEFALPQAARWRIGAHDESMSEEDRVRVVQNVDRVLRFLGFCISE